MLSNQTKQIHQLILTSYFSLKYIYIYIYIYIYVFIIPSAQTECDKRSIFKWNLTGLNTEFSFSLTDCQTRAKEFSLSNYLPIAEVRTIGLIPFSRVLVLYEM